MLSKAAEAKAALKEVNALKVKAQEIDDTNAMLTKEKEALNLRANALVANCPEDIVTASDLQYQLRLSEEALRMAQEKGSRGEQEQVSVRRKKQS